MAAPVSSLSLYDVSLGQQHVPRTWNKYVTSDGHQRRHTQPAHPNKPDVKPKLTSAPRKDAPAILWAGTSHQITGYNCRNGSVQHIIDVSKLLNVSCRLTSKVMVARSKDGQSERLVFAVAEAANLTARRAVAGSTSQSHVVAVTVDTASGHVQLLWQVAAKAGTEVVGQISNILVVPPRRRDNTRKGGKVGGVVHRMDKDNEDDKDNDGVDDDTAEVFLVATAIDESAQYTFAIGHQ